MKNMNRKSQILGLVMVAIIALGGTWAFNYAQDDTSDNVATTEQVEQVSKVQISDGGETVSYDGVEGQTALALLKQYTTPQTDEFPGLGEYVVGINDIVADSIANYWSFYVNGEAAQVGAGDYVTKAEDKIEWRLEDVQTFNQ